MRLSAVRKEWWIRVVWGVMRWEVERGRFSVVLCGVHVQCSCQCNCLHVVLNISHLLLGTSFYNNCTYIHTHPHPVSLYLSLTLCFGFPSKGVRLAIQRHHLSDPLFKMGEGKSDTYVADIQRSVFCLCPRGFAVWSPRIFESLAAGCIPVIIADEIQLPFDDILDWREMSVKVKEADVKAGKLKKILSAIPEDRIRRKMAFVERYWRSAVFLPLPAKEDSIGGGAGAGKESGGGGGGVSGADGAGWLQLAASDGEAMHQVDKRADAFLMILRSLRIRLRRGLLLNQI